MKTTIDITEDLALKAKKLAASKGTTLRAIIEDGIRLSLEAEQHAKKFHLIDRSVKGRGLQPEFEGKSWSDIREAAYEHHDS